MSNLREIRKIIYRLKRQYGLPVTIKRPDELTYDLKTGATVKTFTEYNLKKVPVLPTKLLRDFAYDLSYIAANKNFTYGGYYDKDTRAIIIDKRDLPSGFFLTINDYVVFDGNQYNVKEVKLAEHNQAVLAIIEGVKNVQ